MKYIKTYEFFKPIKINSAKPFKVKKNIDKSVQHLQKGIKSLRTRLDDQKSAKSRSKMNQEINNRIQKLKDLNFKKLKQAEYFRNNPIKENVDEDETNLLDILSSDDFKPEDMEKYIGLPDNKYELNIKFDWNDSEKELDKSEFTLLIDYSTLEDLMNLERGSIERFLSMRIYGYYEYYVDNDELNYLNRYLSKELLEKIKKLGELFDYNIDPNEEGEIDKLFNYLSLTNILDDCKSEISSENEEAVKKAVNKILESLPFNICNFSNKEFDLELEFDYNNIIEHMKKNDLKVKNIKEFLENIYELNEITEVEYEGKDEFLDDYKGLIQSVKTSVDKYLREPDEIFPILIEKDNLELFKKKSDLAFFDFNYEGWYKSTKRMELNLFQIAIRYNNKILEWFKTYDFQKNLIEEEYNKINLYKELKKLDIINYEIEEEYLYLVDAEKYNL